MLSIFKLISPKCVFINPDVTNKTELLLLMAEALSNELGIVDSDILYKDVIKRESMSVTSLGYGCAIPHALSAAVSRTAICAAVKPGGINYNAPDEEPVSIIIMMVGPKSGTSIHLKLLSRLARFLHDIEFRNQLKEAETPDDFLRILKNEEEKCL